MHINNPLSTFSPVVGPVEMDGKIAFISASEPFVKDGKTVRRVAVYKNKKRLAVKAVCAERGVTRKALRKRARRERIEKRKAAK